MAFALAEAGASVACHGNRRPADRTGEQIRTLGRESRSFAADLSDPGGADSLYEAVAAAMGPPDVLVNNAGTIHREPSETHDPQAWMTVLQVNLNSVFRLCQLAGRARLERQQGKIVNIASLLSFQGGIRVPAYAASKGGVAQLTKALANEWASRNVQVNAIAPGYFRTDNTMALQQDELRNRQIIDRIPAGRWESRKILRVPPCSWHRPRVTTLRVKSWSWMVVGCRARTAVGRICMTAEDIKLVTLKGAQQFSPEKGLSRQVLAYNHKLMLVRHLMENGWIGTRHSHPHEQLVYVIRGHLQFSSAAGSTFEARAGDSFVVPGGVEHQARAFEESEVIDVFTPSREDYVALN